MPGAHQCYPCYHALPHCTPPNWLEVTLDTSRLGSPAVCCPTWDSNLGAVVPKPGCTTTAARVSRTAWNWGYGMPRGHSRSPPPPNKSAGILRYWLSSGLRSGFCRPDTMGVIDRDSRLQSVLSPLPGGLPPAQAQPAPWRNDWRWGAGLRSFCGPWRAGGSSRPMCAEDQAVDEQRGVPGLGLVGGLGLKRGVEGGWPCRLLDAVPIQCDTILRPRWRRNQYAKPQNNTIQGSTQPQREV